MKIAAFCMERPIASMLFWLSVMNAISVPSSTENGRKRWMMAGTRSET